MKVFEHLPHIDFMKYKGMALAISWGIILVCFLWIHPWKGADSHVKLGMQFTGGIDMMVAFKGDVHQDDVRDRPLQRRRAGRRRWWPTRTSPAPACSPSR